MIIFSIVLNIVLIIYSIGLKIENKELSKAIKDMNKKYRLYQLHKGRL